MAGRWAVLTVLAAGALGGCVREPSDADLMQALGRYHQAWSARQQAAVGGEAMAPLVDLAGEASRFLKLRSVRKEQCRRAHDSMGFVCTVGVEATTPFIPVVRQRLEARFVEGVGGWVAVNPRPAPIRLGDAR